MNVKKCTATIVIMTTEIISLVLLVLMAIVIYFVMKNYSVLRAVECNLHTFHDAGIEVTGQRMGQTDVVHKQTTIWRVENKGRILEEHDERKIHASQLRFVENITSLSDFGCRNYDIIYLINTILTREEPILGLFASFCFKCLQR